jgi:glycosyltransferase involved in cell wall biosynthesis
MRLQEFYDDVFDVRCDTTGSLGDFDSGPPDSFPILIGRSLGMQPSAKFSESGPRLRGQVALSVVAPCYNEQLSLQAFVDRMIAVCVGLGETYEIVLVNDGWHDRTWELIQELVAGHPTLVGVNLARNHGHQLAVSAGLTLAQGNRVLYPPEVLPRMWFKMNEGYDVVYGKRTRRPNETAWLRRIGSTAFFKLFPRWKFRTIRATFG